MDVPQTVRTALEDRPVRDAVCLEAGAGVGNTTAGLLDAGAARVYAVTNDRDHAKTVRERVCPPGSDTVARTAVLESDLRRVPLADDSVDVVTAHGLFNVLTPAHLDAVASELTRVAAPNCHLVIDDYDPLPEDAAVRDLFAVENAAAELADGTPALTFYPAAVLRQLFAGYGWTVERQMTLLDPVPWTAKHLAAHVDVVRDAATDIPNDLASPLVQRAEELATTIGSEETGTMYSLAFRRVDRPRGRTSRNRRSR